VIPLSILFGSLLIVSSAIPFEHAIAYGGGGGALPPTTAARMREQRYITPLLPRGTPQDIVERGEKICGTFTGPKQRSCITSYAQAYMRSLSKKKVEKSRANLLQRRRKSDSSLFCEQFKDEALADCILRFEEAQEKGGVKTVRTTAKGEAGRLTSGGQRGRPSRRTIGAEPVKTPAPMRATPRGFVQ